MPEPRLLAWLASDEIQRRRGAERAVRKLQPERLVCADPIAAARASQHRSVYIHGNGSLGTPGAGVPCGIPTVRRLVASELAGAGGCELLWTCRRMRVDPTT